MFFFFNDTATTEIYTLSLHDALPILGVSDPVSYTAVLLVAEQTVQFVSGLLAAERRRRGTGGRRRALGCYRQAVLDRKSTRLNSSHANISYAVFCLKKKKKYTEQLPT